MHNPQGAKYVYVHVKEVMFMKALFKALMLLHKGCVKHE